MYAKHTSGFGKQPLSDFFRSIQFYSNTGLVFVPENFISAFIKTTGKGIFVSDAFVWQNSERR
jgi:hypothetical protein